MVASRTEIYPAAERLTHDEASRLARLAFRGSAQTVILDLTLTFDASTAAFARLVLLRSELLRAGRDLRIAGLSRHPAQLFEVHRLQGVLPRLASLPSLPPKAPRRSPQYQCM